MALDRINIWGASDIGHAAGPGWNLLFADSHVEYRISAAVQSYALNTPLEPKGGHQMGDHWEYLLKGIEMLEGAQ